MFNAVLSLRLAHYEIVRIVAVMERVAMVHLFVRLQLTIKFLLSNHAMFQRVPGALCQWMIFPDTHEHVAVGCLGSSALPVITCWSCSDRASEPVYSIHCLRFFSQSSHSNFALSSDM